MSRKEKILETVHSGAVSAVQEEPEGKEGWDQAMTAQASTGKGEEPLTTWERLQWSKPEGRVRRRGLGGEGGSRYIR